MEKPVAKPLFHCNLSRQTGHLSLQQSNGIGHVFTFECHSLCCFRFVGINIIVYVCGHVDPGAEDGQEAG